MRLFFTLVLLIGLARAYDSQLKGPGLSVELIAENRNIVPGEPFTVGLHIHHFAGFHTYWKNPGIVGVATALDWTLPEGFTASEISWPYPEKSLMATHPCHGYERDVTLLVTITPPHEITTEFVTLSARAIWMCCAKGCFPGSRSFQMTLPVSPDLIPDPSAKAHIQKARAEIPQASDQIHALLLSPSDGSDLKVKFTGIRAPQGADLYFFSGDHQISSNQKQKFTRESDGSLILSVPRSEYSPKELPSLRGILKVNESHYAIEAFPQH